MKCGLIDSATLLDAQIGLSHSERIRLDQVIKSHTPDAPVINTHLIEHKIDTGDAQPIKKVLPCAVSPYVFKKRWTTN